MRFRFRRSESRSNSHFPQRLIDVRNGAVAHSARVLAGNRGKRCCTSSRLYHRVAGRKVCRGCGLRTRTIQSEFRGEMAEWLKAHAWKACLEETLTWVRIPLSPPSGRAENSWTIRQQFLMASWSRLVVENPKVTCEAIMKIDRCFALSRILLLFRWSA